MKNNCLTLGELYPDLGIPAYSFIQSCVYKPSEKDNFEVDEDCKKCGFTWRTDLFPYIPVCKFNKCKYKEEPKNDGPNNP